MDVNTNKMNSESDLVQKTQGQDILSDSVMPMVSIVIPAYNHADYLEEAINSIQSQSYSNIELIVINDGSTDNTADILKKYQNIKGINQENIGQAQTLNNGWDMSKGEILAYLSADDILLPEAVKTTVSFFQSNPLVIATYCDFNLIDPFSRIVRRVNTSDYNYKSMLTNVNCPIGPGAFFRKTHYIKAGGWNQEFKQMPDYDFWLRLGLFGQFIRIPKVLAGFRIHENSQTFSVTDCERANEPIDIISTIYKHNNLPEEIAQLKNKTLSSAYLVSSQLHLRAGRIFLGLNKYAHAIFLSPLNAMSLRSIRILFNSLFNRLGHRLLWVIRGDSEDNNASRNTQEK